MENEECRMMNAERRSRAATNNTNAMKQAKQRKRGYASWQAEAEKATKAWHDRILRAPEVALDGAALALLAQAQFPAHPELAAAFERVTRGWEESDLYTRCIDPMEFLSRWDFAFSEFLDHPEWGTLTIDFVHDADGPGGIAIGGIEYLDRVMGYHRSADEWALEVAGAGVAHAVMLKGQGPSPLTVVHVRTGARRAE